MKVAPQAIPRPHDALFSRRGISVMIITRVVLNEADLARRVKAVARKLSPDVVRIRYEIALDSTDKEAIFFRIVLSDDASREEKLRQVAESVESELSKRLKMNWASGCISTFEASPNQRSLKSQLGRKPWPLPRTCLSRHIIWLAGKGQNLDKRACGGQCRPHCSF
ncbi:MAG TPA: hypothetical protein VN924_04950 [Bryobacteraceae bacterium]|nr:hypothetical protein [Bryobacteraceae bacterium]